MSWNWDHLRFFLALAEEGTLTKAAQQLGVSHTTVQRRVHAFETNLAANLFNHTPQGYSLTAEGERLRAEASKMQETIEAISREITGADAVIAGDIVITTTDTIAFTVLPRLLAELGERHPELRFTLQMINRLSDIDSREADIAIRTCLKPPEQLVGRRIGTVRFVACASRGYVEKYKIDDFPEHSNAHRFIMLDSSYAATPFYRWLDQRRAPETVCTTVNNFLAAAATCSAGMGITVLPSHLFDELPELVELPVTGDDIATNSLWMLSHAGVRDIERVRVVRRSLYDSLSAIFG